MQILFDLQEEFESYKLGNFSGTAHIVPVGDSPPTLSVELVDDVKTIRVQNREDRIAGLGVPLSALPQLKVGDRIVVTGRVPKDVPAGSWGVALVTEETDTRKSEECQLAQFTSPKALFALSHILGKSDLNSLLMVQTTRWGAINPTMDFSIDNILFFRDGKYGSVIEDPRTMVYSFANDEKIKLGGWLPGGDARDSRSVENRVELTQSGDPDIKIFKRGDTKALHIGHRVKDWDGVDINTPSLNLVQGNKYEVVVTGCIDGDVPDGTIITLQGIPGYSWRNNQFVYKDQFFTLRHTLSQADVDQWKIIRITTNSNGSTVSFYIYSIEIKRLGLL
ncbi:MAG: hypothetical protein FWC89_00845 [Defluviitaleaceae bacterium]|nr:hypothetical protein [Defluviitaleaceae bacterium]